MAAADFVPMIVDSDNSLPSTGTVPQWDGSLGTCHTRIEDAKLSATRLCAKSES